MFKLFTLAATSAALAVGLVSPAFALPSDFTGTWVNKNPNTRSITHFVVTSDNANTLKIQVYGKCHPSDCDWGKAALVTYGLNIQDTQQSKATANFNQGFANNLLTLDNAGSEVLVQEFTQFLDNSGRHNYYNREYFQRSSKKVEVNLPVITPTNIHQ